MISNIKLFILIFFIQYCFCIKKNKYNNLISIRNDTLNYLNNAQNSLKINSFKTIINKENNQSINSFENEVIKYYYENINKNKKNSNLNYNNRIILTSNYTYNSTFSDFNFFNYKSFSKLENGRFLNILILTSINNSLIFSDLYSNILYIYNTSFQIGKIVSFLIKEENELYLIDSSFTKIYKFKINFYKILIDTNKEENNIKEKIKVETYLESYQNGLEPRDIYNLTYNYKSNIKKITYNIIKENVSFSLNESDDKIENIKPIIYKGLKNLMMITKKGNIYKLNNNLLIIFQKNININNVISPYFFSSFFSYLNKEKNIVNINLNYNISIDITKCKVNNEEIIYYVYESSLHVLFALTRSNKIYYAIPSLYSSNYHSCEFYFLTNIQIENTQKMYIKVLRRTLMIINLKYEIEIIDVSNFDWDNPEEINQFHFEKEFIKLELNENKKLNFPKIIKNLNEYYMIVQESDKNFLFYYIPSLNNKMKGNEQIKFNFKIPVIIISLVVIFFYNYYKKKNEKDLFQQKKYKGEILEQLRKLSNKNEKKYNTISSKKYKNE